MRFCFDSKEFIEHQHRAEALAVIGSDFELTWTEFEKAVEEFSVVLVDNQVHLSEETKYYSGECHLIYSRLST